jgi:hypothetical protein
MNRPLQTAETTGFRQFGTEATRRAASASPASGPIRDMIAQRAYLKWIARGRRSDTALQDWLEAESEVKADIRGERRS